MYLKITSLLVVVFAYITNADENVAHDNQTLYKVYPRNHDQLTLLKEMYHSNGDYDFWQYPKMHEYVNVVSQSKYKSAFEEFLRENNINFEVTLENIQKTIEDQVTSRNKRNTEDRRFSWTNFQLLEQIYEWLDELAEQNPGLVTTVLGGDSHEGRDIKGIRISRGSGRRAFFLEGGMAGADWISPTVLTYIINQLVYGDDDETRRASNDYDWYIFPVTNPDGYNFSHSSVRAWVKNRRPVSNNAIGVDLTKNWNYHWGETGASFTPASNNYVGIGPFSEPETRSLSRYIETISPQLVGYLSFRSFGQRLLVPFADSDIPMLNYNQMMTIGRRAMGSLSVRYGAQYIVGTSAAVHDGSTGSAADWVKQRFDPPVVATFQLRDTGSWGYILPVANVLPSCEETFDGLLAIIREARFINVL